MEPAVVEAQVQEEEEVRVLILQAAEVHLAVLAEGVHIAVQAVEWEEDHQEDLAVRDLDRDMVRDMVQDQDHRDHQDHREELITEVVVPEEVAVQV